MCASAPHISSKPDRLHSHRGLRHLEKFPWSEPRDCSSAILVIILIFERGWRMPSRVQRQERLHLVWHVLFVVAQALHCKAIVIRS
jgi:hypothetical protein